MEPSKGNFARMNGVKKTHLSSPADLTKGQIWPI